MTPKEFIDILPAVLLYIVPGFIVLKYIETYIPKKKASKLETVLWSVFYSFITTLMTSAVLWIYRAICLNNRVEPAQIQEGDNIYIAISLGSSVVIGFIITKLANSVIGDFFARLFNRNMSMGEDVWFKCLRTRKGVWATVYLKNGFIYTGIVSEYTANPDDDKKLILLKRFRLMNRNEEKCKAGKKQPFCVVVEDRTNDNTARVLLRYDDIVAIELVD